MIFLLGQFSAIFFKFLTAISSNFNGKIGLPFLEQMDVSKCPLTWFPFLSITEVKNGMQEEYRLVNEKVDIEYIRDSNECNACQLVLIEKMTDL